LEVIWVSWLEKIRGEYYSDVSALPLAPRSTLHGDMRAAQSRVVVAQLLNVSGCWSAFKWMWVVRFWTVSGKGEAHAAERARHGRRPWTCKRSRIA
jgi:hypothetical protein